jgi:hypothetical protein
MDDKPVWTPQEMGRKGGRISKRKLTPEQARAMVEARERKKKENKKQGE